VTLTEHVPQVDTLALEPGDQISESLVRTLPGSAHSSSEVFAAEQEHIFETMWVRALRASELPGPGDFRTVQVGREGIIVSRDRKGRLRAFFNLCRHRGARVCSEGSGSGRRSSQCGHHAWTYDLDGRLIAAPNPHEDARHRSGGVRPARRPRARVAGLRLDLRRRRRTLVRGDGDGCGALSRLGDVESIEHHGVETLQVGQRITYDVKANGKLIVENFMECYHCATIHPELTEVLPEFADGLAAQYVVGHGAEFGEDVQGFTVDGPEGLGRIPGVTDDQDRRYFAVTIRPNVFVNLVPDHVIFHRTYPMGPDRTIVECDWLYLPEVVASGTDLTKSVKLFDLVNRQDFEACEMCQAATDSKKYADGGVLVSSEHHIAEFQSWATAAIA